MTKLSKAQQEAMKQIYRLTVNSSYASRFKQPTAGDLVTSLATLGYLQTHGLIKGARDSETNAYPRHSITWSLTDKGMTYCKENFGS